MPNQSERHQALPNKWRHRVPEPPGGGPERVAHSFLGMRSTPLGVCYGMLAFVAGFIFGAIRELVLIPTFGSKGGHLIEFPLVLIAVSLIARWLVRTEMAGLAAWNTLVAGVIGVLVLVGIESTFAVAVMGKPVTEYLEQYDVTRGALFPFGLLWMAVAPLVIGYRGPVSTE